MTRFLQIVVHRLGSSGEASLHPLLPLPPSRSQRPLRLCGDSGFAVPRFGSSLVALAIVALMVFASSALAQQKTSYRYFAPAFAHGRILLAATDKYVVVAMDTANTPKVYPEPAAAGRGDARYPVVVPVGGRSVAILTGAVEWFDLMDENAPGVEAEAWLKNATRARPIAPDSGKPGGRPQDERPTLGQGTNAQIEIITEGIAEKLHEVAVDYHTQAELPKGAPLLKVLWVGYGMDGPAVWSARYGFTQEWRAENFYQTRLEHPRTRDLLKSPDGSSAKGMAFAEESYPEAGNLLELLEPLEAQDPRLEKIWSQPSMAVVLTARKTGKGKKITAQQAADFCRALLEASAEASGPVTSERHSIGVLVVDEEGARWIYKP